MKDSLLRVISGLVDSCQLRLTEWLMKHSRMLTSILQPILTPSLGSISLVDLVTWWELNGKLHLKPRVAKIKEVSNRMAKARSKTSSNPRRSRLRRKMMMNLIFSVKRMKILRKLLLRLLLRLRKVLKRRKLLLKSLWSSGTWSHGIKRLILMHLPRRSRESLRFNRMVSSGRLSTRRNQLLLVLASL